MISLVLSCILSLHGWKKKSLSPTGAVAAFLVGFFILSGPINAFGFTLIAFYLIGSRATKYGKNQKTALEDDYHQSGYRDAWQVLSNSATALIAAFIWNTLFAPSSPHAAISAYFGLHFSTLPIYDKGPTGWCPLDITVAAGWSRFLVFVIVGHFACCLGDTLASELGILSPTPPRLITTLRPVPPGTNGAMSLVGTLASLLGGAIVGFIIGASLLLENLNCSPALLLPTIAWGMFAGTFGSLIDSFLGATIQQSRYSESKKKIVQVAGSDTKTIAGLDILSNNQVNLVSSLICAGLIGWASSLM